MLVVAGWRALIRNRVRSLMTMLGIIIGVAAVIAIVAMGNGSKARMEAEIQEEGDNSIEISAANPTGIGPVKTHPMLHVSDAQELRAACPSVRYVTAEQWTGQKPIVYESINANAFVFGVGPDFFPIHNFQLAQGESFTEDDVAKAARVCVLGAKTADALFGNRDPIGRVVRVKSVGFKVVGVKRLKGGEGGFMRDEDSLFMAPYTTVMRYIEHSQWVDSITASTDRPEQMEAAKDEIRQFLRQHHHLHSKVEDDFEIDDVSVWIERWRTQQAILRNLLGGMASISLVVGGIGIMNIMLVSVTQRIKEIGTRMAIGARPGDILLQFLAEALTLSLGGGILGIIVGVVTAAVVDKKWSSAIVSGDSIVLAFGVSCAIGVFFGLYPAVKASRLDPIVALRHE
jgi:putative ABC transport system permease protein